MAIMVEELKSSKKDSRSSKNNKNNNNPQQKLSRAAVLEAISQGGKLTSYTCEDGSVKMKLVVKKQDLKQILGTMNNAGIRPRPKASPAPQTPLSSMERRLFELMKKKKANAQVKGANNLSSWRPNLQSIPEEH